MTKLINKKMILIASAVLLAAVTVSVTLAVVFTKTEPVENVFDPSKVACAVVENGGEPISGSLVNTGNSKDNVQIPNTGNTDAYIRVAVVVNWMSEDGTRVWARKPVLDTDYTITYNLSDDGWFYGDDGYYYYRKSVSHKSPDNLTDVLITKAALIDGVTAPEGADGIQYYFSVEIVATAIQSAPSATVESSWGVEVDTDGNIVKN